MAIRALPCYFSTGDSSAGSIFWEECSERERERVCVCVCAVSMASSSNKIQLYSLATPNGIKVIDWAVQARAHYSSGLQCCVCLTCVCVCVCACVCLYVCMCMHALCVFFCVCVCVYLCVCCTHSHMWMYIHTRESCMLVHVRAFVCSTLDILKRVQLSRHSQIGGPSVVACDHHHVHACTQSALRSFLCGGPHDVMSE